MEARYKMRYVITSSEQFNFSNLYENFLDYAFTRTNCFAFVCTRRKGQKYSENIKLIQQDLSFCKIKSKRIVSWLNKSYNSSQHESTVFYYKNTEKAKNILKKINNLDNWNYFCGFKNPQDLSFFYDENCWFNLDGEMHRCIIIDPNENDIQFLKENDIKYTVFK